MLRQPIPPQNFPAQICGAVPNSWAETTMYDRLPGLVADLCSDVRFSPKAIQNLADLQAALPQGRIRHLKDEAAPDHAAWQRYIEPQLGETWLTANWFFAETYFYRRVLEATGYFMPGPGEKLDPYQPQKQLGLVQARPLLPPLAAQLNDAAQSTFRHHDFRFWLSNALWGNQADLSLWSADDADQPANKGDDPNAQILADDTDQLSPLFEQDPLTRIDIILDNAGIELVGDLLLVDYLFRTEMVSQVVLHCKAHPTFVSDAIIKDVQQTIRFLSKHGDEGVILLGERIANYVANGQLLLEAHFYWNSPLFLWELDSALRRRLAGCDLIISKGDANYRRILGDYYWPDDHPFAAVGTYVPAPLLSLRTLKSEMVVGLTAAIVGRTESADPTWRIDGRWGVMQLAMPSQ